MLDSTQQDYLNEIKRHFVEIKTLINRIEGRETLQMTVRTTNALIGHGILTLDQLVFKTEIDLLRIEGLGRKSVREVKEVLAEKGLCLCKEKS